MLASGEWVNFGSNECTEISFVGNQLIFSSILKHMVSKDFIFKKSVQVTSSVSCQEWKNLWHCSISKFFMLCYIIFKKGNFNMWVTSGSYVGTSRLFCGSVGLMGQQVWPTFDQPCYAARLWKASRISDSYKFIVTFLHWIEVTVRVVVIMLCKWLDWKVKW